VVTCEVSYSYVLLSNNLELEIIPNRFDFNFTAAVYLSYFSDLSDCWDYKMLLGDSGSNLSSGLTILLDCEFLSSLTTFWTVTKPASTGKPSN